MKKYLCWFLPILFLTTPDIYSQNAAFSPSTATESPVIDGILSDPVWSEAEQVTGFITYDPDYGMEMPFKTIAWMSYDDENLYFAFRCFDPEPDKIKVSVDSRDNIFYDDWVCINLDSFNDQQGLYAFYVNAYGIQMDSKLAAGAEDKSLDFIWYSAGLTDEEGYSVEIQIPLKSIRFAKGDPVMMGMILERKISRIMVNGTFPALDPDQGWSFQTQMMPVEYYGIKHYSLIELLPAITYSNRLVQSQGNLETSENGVGLSLTTKYSLTPQIIMDATLNPDFSQIEADAGQVDVNLRYEIYYPEKRPFFQEGSENFKAGASSSSVIDPIQSLVYTRKIINPVAGGKISGKAGIKNSLSMIYAADRVDPDLSLSQGDIAHYSIFRYKRSLRDDSFIGTTYTGRFITDANNQLAGVDGQNRLNKSTLIEYQLLGNITTGDSTSKNGAAAGLYLHSEKRDFDYALSAKYISEDFASEAGYITRTGVSYVTGLIKPKIYPENKSMRKVEFEVFSGQLRDNIFDQWETFNHISALAMIGKSSLIKLKYSYSTEIFLGEKFKTGGVHLLLNSQFSKSLSASMLYRRRGSIYYSGTPFQGISNNITSGITFLPSDKLHTEFSMVFQDFYRESDGIKIYDYLISRAKITYQVNRYLFFRTIGEYNSFREELLIDLLASFTYIPGTVLHIGYGSLFDKTTWNGTDYEPAERFLETNRGLFIKASYLYRF